MVLDLHIEGAAPVTLLVRDESRSTRSTSANKDLASDLEETADDGLATSEMSEEEEEDEPEIIELNRDRLSKRRRPRPASKSAEIKHHPQEVVERKPTSLALQIVETEMQQQQMQQDVSKVVEAVGGGKPLPEEQEAEAEAEAEVDAEELTLADEMASFDFIDNSEEMEDKTEDDLDDLEVVTSDLGLDGGSLTSDFDVWSPQEKSKVKTEADWKDRFLKELESSKMLALPARRASAESLSNPIR